MQGRGSDLVGAVVSFPPSSAVRLLRLSVRDFRTHAARTFDLGPGVNLFHGPNGVGKTNVLEAVHYLALTKSFVASSDEVAVRVGAAQAEVTGAFEGERRGAFRVRVAIARGAKRVFVGSVPVPTLAEHVGRVPLVVMAPQDYVLTSGPPDERRRFLDNLLSQARPLYLGDRMRYARALKQRNELLAAARSRRVALNADLLGAWTDELVSLGARVVHARARALADFHGYLDAAYDRLGERVEKPSFTYDGPVNVEPGATIDDVAEALGARVALALPRERETGRTLVGPHRDEVTFRLGTFEVRRYASQGQHRTFGIAVRLAQLLFLRDLTGEMPVLLLDDLFGTLDRARTRVLTGLLTDGTVGQSLVTHPERTDLAPLVDFGDDAPNRAFDLTRPADGAPIADEAVGTGDDEVPEGDAPEGEAED